MNSLELFSGAGGLAKGLELSGLKHVALVEINKNAYTSLCENFDPRKIFCGDVRDFNLEGLDNLDSPAKTIKAGDHGVPGGENMIRFPDGNVRYLTVFEAKLLQTFPHDFVIKGGWGEAMRQIGNAVPVLLAEIIGYELVKTLIAHNQRVTADRIDPLVHFMAGSQKYGRL